MKVKHKDCREFTEVHEPPRCDLIITLALHLSPGCCAAVTLMPPPPPRPPADRPSSRPTEHHCSPQHSARPLTPPRGSRVPTDLGPSRANSVPSSGLQLDPPQPSALVRFPPLPGSGQRNSQQERPMERCPGRGRGAPAMGNTCGGEQFREGLL